MATKNKTAKTPDKKALQSKNISNGASAFHNGKPASKSPAMKVNQYGIPDWRLEHPEFQVFEVSEGSEVHYEIKGKLNGPVPPIRESRCRSSFATPLIEDRPPLQKLMSADAHKRLFR